MKSVRRTILLGLAFAASFNLATAQTLSTTDFSADDTATMLEALELATPTAAAALPQNATWWSAQHAPGMPEAWPPLPGNTLGLDAWPIGDGNYVLNDTNVDYDEIDAEQRAARISLHGGFRADVDIDPSDPGDGGGDDTNFDSGPGFTLPDYGTNLWIAHATVTNGWLTGAGSNTIADVQYEIQSRTNLAQTDWQSEGFIYGMEVTNLTPLSVPQLGRTNLFIRLKSWADDGNSLPIWWQIEYFGTNGVDPYGDPAGDGWSNYQKFEKGWNPTSFYTPPAPQVSASFNAIDSMATVSWLPSPGPVTGYQILKTDLDFDYSGTATTNYYSANTTSFSDDLSADTDPDNFNFFDPDIPVTYQVTAEYAGGNSAPGIAVLGTGYNTDPNCLNGSLINGPNGRLYYVMQNLPADLNFIRVYRSEQSDPDVYSDYDDNGELMGDVSSTFTNGYFEIPVSVITNGICQVPDSQTAPYFKETFWAQSVRSNGVASGWSGISFRPQVVSSLPFIDLRRQMKDSLSFALRGASPERPFEFSMIPNTLSDVFSAPTNCVYEGIHDGSGLDVFKPVNDNCFFRNFAFDPDHLAINGALNTGVYPSGNDSTDEPALSVTNFPLYYFDLPDFVTGANTNVPSSLLASSQTRWLIPDAFTLTPLTETSFPSGQGNFYGLPYLSAELTYLTNDQINLQTLYPGDTTPSYLGYSRTFFEVAQPGYQLANYYFARVGIDPMPESGSFAATNVTPAMFVGLGSSLSIAGYEKLAVTNAYSGTYAYLGQYFDVAYKVNTNGTVTFTNTGVLSPYGDFFATEAGRAALVTMPDIDTGERGTNIVYCVSLQVDKNHDGVMDSTFSGPDMTSQASPMVCWVNNGYTVAGTEGNLDRDFAVPPNHPEYQNYVQCKVTCPRDLENLFRLWIRGVPQLASAQGYSINLRMTALSGNPAINLYTSSDYLGGTGYLTDTNVAANQSRITLDGTGNPEFGIALATINTEQSYTLPSEDFDLNYPYHSRFLFEAAGVGLGQLTMTISQSNNVLCQASVYLDLHDIKDLYERAHATNVTSVVPPSSLISGCAVDHEVAVQPNETKQVIVLVHGINNTLFDYYNSTEVLFKRSYWSGYHGKIAGFRWPCGYLPFDNTYYPFDYNKSEFWAFKSAPAFKDYLSYFRNRSDLTNYTINVLAHSQGNAVASEAASMGAPFDNYILTQGAVPAHAYDATVPTLASLIAADTLTPTPYAASVGGYNQSWTNITGNLINFFNTNDYALASGTWLGFQANWVEDQRAQKPEAFIGGPSYIFYPSNQTSVAYYTFGSHYTVTDWQESRAMVARSRTSAVGAQGGVGGPIKSQVDLISSFKFGPSRDEHSGEFSRSIQTIWGYYDEVLTSYGIMPITR